MPEALAVAARQRDKSQKTQGQRAQKEEMEANNKRKFKSRLPHTSRSALLVGLIHLAMEEEEPK